MTTTMNKRYFFYNEEKARKFIEQALKFKGKTVPLDKESADFLKTLMRLSIQCPPYITAVLTSVAYGNKSFREKDQAVRTLVRPLIKLEQYLMTVPDMIFPDTDLGKDMKRIMKYAVENSVSLKTSYELNFNLCEAIQDTYREPEFSVEEPGDRKKKVLYLKQIYNEFISYAIAAGNAKITFPLFSTNDLKAFSEVRATYSKGFSFSEDKKMLYINRLSDYEKLILGVTTLGDLDIAVEKFKQKNVKNAIFKIAQSFAKSPVLTELVNDPNISTGRLIELVEQDRERCFEKNASTLLVFADKPKFSKFLGTTR